MKVVSDSDLIPVTRSDAMLVTIGAKRRWRSYRASSDRDRSTGIRFRLHFFSPALITKSAAGAVEMWESGGFCRISKSGGKSGQLTWAF
jgi:hypothetical protein